MASTVKEIERPNRFAITSMGSKDLLRAREFYINVLVKANKTKDSDTMQVAIDWIEALTIEMQQRGGKPDPASRIVLP